MFGLNPFAFHAVNLVLHAAVAAVCYRVLVGLECPAPFWVALAFGVHPVQVESVAWVTELKNVLSGLFYGLAWLTLWQACVDRSPQATIATRGVIFGAVLFALALLSKSVTATLPAAMLVAIWYRCGKITSQQWIVFGGLLVAGAAVGWNTARLERLHVGAEGHDWNYGLLDRAGIAARCMIHYMASVALPLEQVFFYPRFAPSISNAGNWLSLVGAILFMLLLVRLAFDGKRGPLAAILFFVGSAFPALGFLNVYPHRFSFVADHFIYLPVIGLLCIIFGILERLSKQFLGASPAFPRWLVAVPLLLTCSLYALQVVRYLPVFSNEITLWEDTLRKNPHCPAAMQNLGLRYSENGEPWKAKGVLEQALEYDFDRYQTLNSLGVVAKQLRDLPLAEKYLNESLQLKPDNHRALVNLANLLRQQSVDGKDEAKLKRARALYADAWKVKQDYLAGFGLAMCLYDLGDARGASEWFSTLTPSS